MNKYYDFFMEYLAIPIVIVCILYAVGTFAVVSYQAGVNSSDKLWAQALCYPEAMISYKSKEPATVEITCSSMKVTVGAMTGLTRNKK